MISIFTLHKCMLDGTSIAAGELAIQVLDNGKIDSVQFRYTQDYLAHPHSRPFMPQGYPLQQEIKAKIYRSNNPHAKYGIRGSAWLIKDIL